MTPWGFVLLAYGIAWIILLLYLGNLKRRLGSVEAELERCRLLPDSESSGGAKS